MLLKNENQNLSQVFFNISNSLCIFYPAILDLDSISIYKLLAPYFHLLFTESYYIHYTNAVQDYVLLLHNTIFGMSRRLTVAVNNIFFSYFDMTCFLVHISYRNTIIKNQLLWYFCDEFENPHKVMGL